MNRRVCWGRKQVATDGKSPSEMAISCCVTYSLPSRPVKVSQTTLDKLVEILKNLHPPTLICRRFPFHEVWHLYKFRSLLSYSWEEHNTNIHLGSKLACWHGNGSWAVPLLHRSAFSKNKGSYIQIRFQAKNLQLNLTENQMLPWPDLIYAKKELQNHQWLFTTYAFILSP